LGAQGFISFQFNMEDSYLKLATQAESLCVCNAGQIVELEAIEAAIELENKQQARGLGLVPVATSTLVRQEKQVVGHVAEVIDITEVPRVDVEAKIPVAEVVLIAISPVQGVVAAGTRKRSRSVG
jgi:hypothetical protein